MTWSVSPFTMHRHKWPHPDNLSTPLRPPTPAQHVPIKEILLLMTLYNLFRQDESFSLMQVTCTFVSSISWQPRLTLGTHIADGL